MRSLALVVGMLLSTSCAAPRWQPQAQSWTAGFRPTGPPLVTSYETFVINEPPPALNLDPFYRKYVDADGIPVIGSEKVPNAALLIARDIVNALLLERPDIRRELVHIRARVGLMAIDEGTMDLPEMRAWTKPAPDDPRLTRCERQFYDQVSALTDREYWNGRARGTGDTYTTSGAEMLLGTPGTRYFGENILIHEFAHNILSAVRTVDPSLYRRVDDAYEQAKGRGLWKYSYAAVTVQEYWAEGTQFWFNSNKVFKYEDTSVLSSDDLKRYDPELYALLGEVYGERHHISADVFYLHPARLDERPIPKDGECKSMYG